MKFLKSIKMLIEDFNPKNIRYKTAHVFFTESKV